MATEKSTPSAESSTTEVTSAANSHGGSENTSTLITGHKLNGHNYLQWSQSVMMFICGKGKDEYLTGEITIPGNGDPKYRKWKTENHMIMSWLINSMNNEIGEFSSIPNCKGDMGCSEGNLL